MPTRPHRRSTAAAVGPPPHQGSSGHMAATVITHAQAERIIALLERIEARLGAGRRSAA